MRAALVLLAIPLLVACIRTDNLCPEGAEPAPGGVCVPVPDASMGDGDAGIPFPDADVSMDGGDDADASGDGGDADTAPLPDASPDAEAGSPPDSAADATAPAPYCAASDVSAWDGFHSSEELVADLTSCAGRCEDQPCLVECTAQKAGLTECLDCMDVEATCLFETCWIACGAGKDATSQKCRACLCEAHCTDRFEACAGRPLTTCDGAFDREPPDGEPTPAGPLLVRYRTSNAYVIAETFEGLGSDSVSLQQTYSTHWSASWTALSSFEREGQSYLVQRRSTCGATPCGIRVAPLFGDGSLGAPVLDEDWSRGWDEVEVFPVANDLYLLAMKTGAEAAEDPGQGSVRIARLDWAQDGGLALTTVLETRWAVAAGNTWSAIEAFVQGGETYLLRYATEPSGDMDIVHVVPGEDGAELRLDAVGEARIWDQGFDQVHTFRAGEEWFVLRYKGGTLGGNGVANGSVEILPLEMTAQGPAPGDVVYAGDWGEGITHVQGVRAAEGDFLFTNRPVTPSRGVLWRLNPVSEWSSALGVRVLERDWNSTRLWNVVTVAKDGRWDAP